MRLRQSYARNCFYLFRLLQRNSIIAFVFIASCMGSSKSKFQLSNADVYRNAGRVVTQKCMVSDNLNTIGHTWSLFRFFTASLLFYNSLHSFIRTPPPEKWLESDPSNICLRPLKNEWNPKGSFVVSSFAKFLFCRLLWKQHQNPVLQNLPPSSEKRPWRVAEKNETSLRG